MSILINNKPLECSKFPGGECHVKINNAEISEVTFVTALLNSSDELVSLLLAVNAIRAIRYNTKIHLTIPYFPYARQDRICHEGEAFSLKVITDLINALSCQSVTVYDPHSDITTSLLDNCHIISQDDIIMNSLLSQDIVHQSLALVAPDKGAKKKIDALAKRFALNNHSVEVFYARKARNARSGQVITMPFYDDIREKNLIIIDDICDGGATFISLAQTLKDAGANKLYLYVTHGIFSQGFAALNQYFDHIYCFHLIRPIEAIPPSMTLFSTNHYLPGDHFER